MLHRLHGERVVASLRTLASSTLTLLGIPIALVMGVWLVGSHNPYTPAGYVGYLT